MGYPENILMKKPKEPSPGILNRGRIRGFIAEPKKLTIPSPMSISTEMKKGRSEGQTTLNQSFKPSSAAEYASFGYMIMKAASRQKIMEYIKVEMLFLFMVYL